MSKLRFTLRELLMLIALAALAISLAVTRSELTEKSKQLDSYRNEMRYLSIADEDAINAISIPGVGQRSWRWRVYVPMDRKFRLRLAFDDIPIAGLPVPAPDKMHCELPPGESILSASLVEENGEWGVSLYSETEGRQNFDFTWEVTGRNVDWLKKRGGTSQRVAGNSNTLEGSAQDPYVLLSLRDGLSPKPGVTQTNPDPTDGVLIWIEKSK